MSTRYENTAETSKEPLFSFGVFLEKRHNNADYIFLFFTSNKLWRPFEKAPANPTKVITVHVCSSELTIFYLSSVSWRNKWKWLRQVQKSACVNRCAFYIVSEVNTRKEKHSYVTET